jgi:hypothetical protein
LGRKGLSKGTKPSRASAPAFENRRQRFSAEASIRKNLDHLLLLPHIVHQFDRPLAANLRMYESESERSQQMTGQRSQWAKDQYQVMIHQFSNRVLKSCPVLRSSSIQQKPCSQHPLSISPPRYPQGQRQGSRIRVPTLDQACSGKQTGNLGQELGRTERLEDKVVGASGQALWRTIHARGHHNHYAL